MIVVVLFVSTVITIDKFATMDLNIYDNDMRILVAQQRNEIEQGIYNKGKYAYIVFDLEGKVLYNDTDLETKQGELVNVQEMLQSDKSFNSKNKGKFKESFVLRQTGKINSFVVFLIPEN